MTTKTKYDHEPRITTDEDSAIAGCACAWVGATWPTAKWAIDDWQIHANTEVGRSFEAETAPDYPRCHRCDSADAVCYNRDGSIHSELHMARVETIELMERRGER